MICYLYEAPKYLFFAEDVPDLLYYSHIPSLVIALLVGFFVYFNARDLLLSKLLLLISLSFSAWVIISLLVWAGNDAELFAFVWPFFGVIAAFLSIFSIYFIHVFLEKKDISKRLKGILLLLLLPILLFAHTDLNVSGFDLVICDSFIYEGYIYKAYYTLLGFLAAIWIFVMLFKHYKLADANFKKQILLMGIGIELFLFSFITSTFVASYLVKIGLNENSSLEMYSLFSMSILMMLIGILIVRFKTFRVGLLASTALVVALLILTASQYTYVDTPTARVLTVITVILTAAVGAMLVRSVRKEVKQRIELQELTQKLAIANERLKDLDKQKSEFLSIASHQLRSPLAAIRGYASMLLEGSFGKTTEQMREPLERIHDSAKNMATAVEDYLNVSRIEAGNMKYSLSDFNLCDEVDHLCDDMRPEAIKKGIALIYRTEMNSRGVVHADQGKTIQIVQNLITNAIKYTPKGTIRVLVRDDVVRKKIYVDVIDTGIGMNEKALNTVFGKFERAENANTVNVHGTGLGLFVALKMALAMDGNITAYSEGDGKGSRFTFEIPLAL